MKIHIIVMIFAFTLIAGMSNVLGELSGSSTNVPSISEMNEAVEISIGKLQSTVTNASAYKLTAVQQLYINGKYIWGITFTPEILLHHDPSKVFDLTGSRINITVDLENEKASMKQAE